MDPHRIGYLLTPGFAVMSFASITEPFRAANRLSGRELYRWRTLSLYGGPIPDAGGAAFVAEAAFGESAFDTVFVFAAGEPQRFAHPPTFAWLRRLAANGVAIGGVSGGPYLLARAGLLDGYRATIHWEHSAAFAETFRRIEIDPGLFVIDRGRLSCAGGMAGFELAIELITRAHGAALGEAVRDWFVGPAPRIGTRPQRAGGERFCVPHPGVRAALARMEDSLHAPLTRADLAVTAGVGVRQLERLFVRHLGQSVRKYYTRLRFERTDELLRQSTLPMLEIAVACGFNSAADFARSFRRHFGRTPTQWRNASVREQLNKKGLGGPTIPESSADPPRSPPYRTHQGGLNSKLHAV